MFVESRIHFFGYPYTSASSIWLCVKLVRLVVFLVVPTAKQINSTNPIIKAIIKITAPSSVRPTVVAYQNDHFSLINERFRSN